MSTIEILGLIFGPIAATVLGYLTVRITAKKSKQEAAETARQEKEDRDAQFILDEKANAETDEVRAARISKLQLSEITRLSEEMKEMRARMDTLEKRDRAFINLINDAARQWPADHAGPTFHPIDIAAVNGDMPSTWVLGHA